MFHTKTVKNKILLVDDDIDLLETIEEGLSLSGYEIITANNGKKAVELYKENNPCITLMDIKMPQMDGYETFSKIKEISNDAKIIFITGYETISKTQIARNQGLIGILEKPIKIKEIINIIQKNKC